MRVLEKVQASLRVSKRLMTSVILVLLILVTMAWVACGGTDNVSTPTVPSTQVGGADLVTNVPGDDSGVSSTGAEKLFLSADQFDEVSISLAAGDVLKMTYISKVSISPGLGGTGHQERGVLLVVLDPLGEQILTSEETSMNTVEVTAQTSGEHEIVFINPNKLEGLNVELEYAINP